MWSRLEKWKVSTITSFIIAYVDRVLSLAISTFEEKIQSIIVCAILVLYNTICYSGIGFCLPEVLIVGENISDT